MPLPGFQNPTPYLAPDVARKLYTSLLMSLALARSLLPSICAWIKWSQWMVEGTATCSEIFLRTEIFSQNNYNITMFRQRVMMIITWIIVVHG